MKFCIINELIESSESKTLILRPEEPDLIYRYKAGQYCILKIELHGILLSRCYSFSSPESDRSEIAITVKRVEGGIVSNYLVNNSVKGRTLNISQPYGKFHRHMFSDNKPLVFLAAGSGITPIISIIETLAEKTRRQITLLYFNSNISNAIFYNRLKKISERNESIKIFMFSTKEENKETIFGYLNKNLIINYCPNISDSQIAICGPHGFMETSEKISEELGMEKNNIFREEFSVKRNESSIMQQTNNDLVEVTFSCVDKPFLVQKNSTVLDIAEKNGIEIPHECCIGSCGE